MTRAVVLIACLAPLLSSPLHAAISTKIGPSAFINGVQARFVRLSPSGRYLTRLHDGSTPNDATKPARGMRQYLEILDLDGGKASAVALPLSAMRLAWVEWASDERLLLGLTFGVSVPALDMNFLFASRVVAIDRDGRNPVTLFEGDRSVLRRNPFLSDIVNLLPLDPNQVLMSAQGGSGLDLWRVDVASGASERIKRGGPQTVSWATTRAGEPVLRLDLSYRGTHYKILAPVPGKRRWKKVASGRLDPKHTPDYWPVAVDPPDPTRTYVLAPWGENGTVVVAAYDFAEHTVADVVFAQPTHDVAGVITDHYTGAYLGAWYIEDRVRIALRDRRLQAHIDGLNRFFGNEANVAIRGTSADGRYWLVLVSGPRHPGDFYRYDVMHKDIHGLFSLHPQLRDEHLSKVEVVSYQSSDGQRLTAYVTHPNRGENQPAPLVVMPHGGPAVRDMYDYHPMAQYLASRGYRVVQPNFRGSSGYGRRFVESAYGEWDGLVQEDIAAITRALQSGPLATAERTCIVGQSFGGYSAAMQLIEHPDLYACGVAISGVYDLRKLADFERRQEGRDSDAYQDLLRQLGVEHRDRKLLDEHSPQYAIERIRAPMLVMHGRFDQVIPIEQAEAFVETLQQAGKPVQYVRLTAAHRNWPVEVQESSYLRVARFLDEAIGGVDELPAIPEGHPASVDVPASAVILNPPER